MQNIMDILKAFNVEIPQEKASEFESAVLQNYKTIADYNKQISKVQKAESERDGYKEQLDTAKETLKGFEGVDLKTIQDELSGWKKKAEDAEAEFNKRIYERDFSDVLKAELDSIKFSSDAAKRAVTNEIKESDLKLKDGKILGLNDLIGQIKTRDASAFVDEQQENLEDNKAKFTSSMGGNNGGSVMTKADIMKIKNSSERQAAIAAHRDLFT